MKLLLGFHKEFPCISNLTLSGEACNPPADWGEGCHQDHGQEAARGGFAKDKVNVLIMAKYDHISFYQAGNCCYESALSSEYLQTPPGHTSI